MLLRGLRNQYLTGRDSVDEVVSRLEAHVRHQVVAEPPVGGEEPGDLLPGVVPHPETEALRVVVTIHALLPSHGAGGGQPLVRQLLDPSRDLEGGTQ